MNTRAEGAGRMDSMAIGFRTVRAVGQRDGIDYLLLE